MNGYLAPKQLALLIGKHYQTVYDWARQGTTHTPASARVSASTPTPWPTGWSAIRSTRQRI
jgi:hypothetical protein